MSIDDINKLEEKEMKKIRPFKTNLYDWLINSIPEPITKIIGGFKGKILSFFYINTPKRTCMGEERNKENQKHKNSLKKTKIKALGKRKKRKKRNYR